jgi:hypothetical protein
VISGILHSVKAIKCRKPRLKRSSAQAMGHAQHALMHIRRRIDHRSAIERIRARIERTRALETI